VATIRQYVNQLWNVQQAIARQLGFDLNHGELRDRAIVLSSNLTSAVILKTLVDKGVITDADLQASMDGVKRAKYKQQPNDSDWHSDTDSTGASSDPPPPDLG
jgi:hypothetical protein